MKKWMLLVLVIVMVLVSCLYLFTPSSGSFSKQVTIPVTSNGGFREIYNHGNWIKWWPGEKIAEDRFRFGRHEYRITDKKLSSMAILITGGNDSIASVLNLVISGRDSLGLVWAANSASSINPVARLRHGFSHAVQDEVSGILNTLRAFYSNEKNVYGFEVERLGVPDTSLVSVAQVITGMPSTELIYGLLDRLHTYISDNNSKETNPPMVNVSRDGDSMLVRVAIPIDRRLPDSGNISYRWMLPGGSMCVATYTGGPKGSLNAMRTMVEYLKDHDLKQPAIPYLSLVTDRRTEPDTSKWITKIYCPYY